MIGAQKSALDVGCAEGLGTWLLAKECGQALGIDFDAEAVAQARKNWPATAVDFQCGDFHQLALGRFDAVVSFDVIEHVPPAEESRFLDKIADHLGASGICIIGTPSEASQAHASAIAKTGHINIHSAEKLEAELRQRFKHVFLFSAHDEMVHTGFLPLAHYLIALACLKKG
ncbi:MAG: class I SAM-dependent methyltransferase, partial [Chitinivibrionia bacterium]|nr:class I SAM-dependent methyltransferase [Chitinivibrionia bacterium]